MQVVSLTCSRDAIALATAAGDKIVACSVTQTRSQSTIRYPRSELFQVISGMYDLAEGYTRAARRKVPVMFQALPLPSLKSVPPTATLNGVEAYH